MLSDRDSKRLLMLFASKLHILLCEQEFLTLNCWANRKLEFLTARITSPSHSSLVTFHNLRVHVVKSEAQILFPVTCFAG